MYLWNTHRLAESLGHQELTGAEKFQYFFLLQAIVAVSGYIAWLFVRPSANWVFWFEAAMVLIVTIAGLKRCRERYEVATQDRFVEDCVILQVPLTIKFLAFLWLTHFVLGYFLTWAVPMLKPETFEEATRVNILVKLFFGAYPFFLMLFGNALFYIRLSLHMETAARAQRL